MEMEPFHPSYTIRQPTLVYLDPILLQRRVLEDQVELWWFREPRRSLFCYCASVALILALGFGGVGLLSTTTSLSGEWRLGVGATLCLLALTVLLKQLLSSAVQDMNCVYNRRRIDQLKSGGRADPALILAVGLGVMLCGTVLLGLATTGRRSYDREEMFVSSVALMAAGAGMALAVASYSVLVCVKRRREHRRRRRRSRLIRVGRQENPAVTVFSVSGGRVNQSGTDTTSSRISQI